MLPPEMGSIDQYALETATQVGRKLITDGAAAFGHFIEAVFVAGVPGNDRDRVFV